MILAGTVATALGLLLLCAAPGRVAAAPDPGGALAAFAAAPLHFTGDVAGGAGLLAAGAVGLAGDGVALLDANRFTLPLLGGVASGPIHRAAHATSWASTGLMEGLRGEDLEPLPEPVALYTTAAPGLGHLESMLSGLRALALAPEDLLLHPALGLARAVGWRTAAARIETRLDESRTRALGAPVER
jgi:hypothetical protein